VASENNVYIAKLLRALRRAERSVVLRYRDESFSGEALLTLIIRYAQVLRDLGIGRGTLLSMFAPNHPEAIAIRYAAHVLGAATVDLSAPPTESQRRALVDQIAPDLLVLFPETMRYLGQRVSVPFVTIGIDKAGSRGRLDALAASASMDSIEVSAKRQLPKLRRVHRDGQRKEPERSDSTDQRAAGVSFAGPRGYYAARRRACCASRRI
jgi:fatty-acyl-CoA synthase